LPESVTTLVGIIFKLANFPNMCSISWPELDDFPWSHFFDNKQQQQKIISDLKCWNGGDIKN